MKLRKKTERQENEECEKEAFQSYKINCCRRRQNKREEKRKIMSQYRDMNRKRLRKCMQRKKEKGRKIGRYWEKERGMKKE